MVVLVIYSSLLPKHIESLTEILDTWGKQEKIKRIDSVIDATAHIGCDTVFLTLTIIRLRVVLVLKLVNVCIDYSRKISPGQV